MCYWLKAIEFLRFCTKIGSKLKCFLILFLLYFSKSMALREYDYRASTIGLNRKLDLIICWTSSSVPRFASVILCCTHHILLLPQWILNFLKSKTSSSADLHP